MSFLPVVERELRVASRKRSTYWVRVVAAAAALMIGAGFLTLARVASMGTTGPGPFSGSGLFAVLTWLSLAGALSAGVFLTSDCLSEEKRDGTIGLLFLTDLRGHDVVLGKLLATSLRAGCAILGVFPILAITLLMGGVSFLQFWQSCLALTVALLLSLSVGLFVSTISRASQKALGATLFLLLAWSATGPLVDTVIAAANDTTFNPILSHSSPVRLFMIATSPGSPPGFWTGLITQALSVAVLLGAAGILLPRSWQQGKPSAASAPDGWTQWWKFGGRRVRESARRGQLDSNPVLWLAGRERWQALFLWCVAVLQAVACGTMFYVGLFAAGWVVWNSLAGLLTLLLYLGLASHASRFFVEARRSGLIELTLSTPLSSQQIVQGQWQALVQLFGLPLLICLVTQLLGSYWSQLVMWESVAASASAASAASAPAAAASTPLFQPPAQILALATAAAGTLVIAANLIALAWFGMWMGLNSRNTNLATLKTILYVQLIPWFAVNFASGLIIPLLLLPTLMSGTSTPPASMMLWFPLLSTALATVLNLAKDLVFVTWSRRKLYGELRNRVALGRT